jgi:hypothetical protein
MNILALDLGTRTGWAMAENGRTKSGVQLFDVKRGESPGMRYLRFNRWLEDMAAGERKPDLADDNEADALWILQWARIEFEPARDLVRNAV